VVADRQAGDDIGELPAVRRVIRERVRSPGSELDEWRLRIGSKPEHVLLEPTAVGEPKLKAANAHSQPAELGGAVRTDSRRLDERKSTVMWGGTPSGARGSNC
jgi:hypothetical protein